MSATDAPGVQVRTPSRKELNARRRALLKRVGMSFEELERRAADGDLSADEYWTLRDVQAIDYLLDA